MNKTEIFDKLKLILADKLDIPVEEVTEEKTMKDLGADSLDAVEAIMEVEKDFDLAIPDDHMENFTNIKSIVDYIAENTK